MRWMENISKIYKDFAEIKKILRRLSSIWKSRSMRKLGIKHQPISDLVW